MAPQQIALAYCDLITRRKDMPNATARLGAWLVGVASRLGGFPVELSFTQMRDGFETPGGRIDGTGSRTETIRASLGWLEENGLLSSTEGSPVGFGYTSRIYTLNLERA